MNNQHANFQQLLIHQIKIRDLQGRWRRISSLNEIEIEQLWNETNNEIGEWENHDQLTNSHYSNSQTRRH